MISAQMMIKKIAHSLGNGVELPFGGIQQLFLFYHHIFTLFLKYTAFMQGSHKN